MTAHAGEHRRVRYWRHAATVVLCLAMAVPVVSSRLGGWCFWLLFLMGLASLSRHLAPIRPERSLLADAAFWWICLAPLALNLLSVLWLRLPMREVVMVPLLAMPAFVILMERVRPDLNALAVGALLATLLALVVSAWGALYLGVKRPGPPGMNQIIFGQLTVLATVTCACAWRARHVLRGSAGSIAGPIGVTAGIAAIFLASFLGGMLALPVVVLALFAGKRLLQADTLSRTRIGVTAAVVAMAALASLPPIIERVQDMAGQVEQWRGGRVDKSSAGTRIELARASASLIAQRPWFGLGSGRFQDGLRELRASGNFPEDVQLMRHAHNTYLNTIVEFGFIGFAVMLSVIVLLGRRLRAGKGFGATLGLAGLAAWLLLGLTNDLFAHQSILRAMSLLFAVCLVASAQALQTSDSSA